MAKKSAGKRPVKTKSAADDRKFLCYFCGKEKKRSDFYVSTDPNNMFGVTYICKHCVRKIAMNWDENRQEFGACTKKSVMWALEYIDRPYLNRVWDSSYLEVHNSNNSNQKTIWDAYIKNIGFPQYRGLRWRDGDIFDTFVEDSKEAVKTETIADVTERVLANDEEINKEFKKNKSDVIRLLGYDPFEHEKYEDQPLLYSQLIGYLDLSGDNEDMMRTSSAITIVRGFLQQAKLDDKVSKCMINTASSNNIGEIKTLLDAKQKVSSTISNLAEQSCLSLKHSKNASKGENTWTGKIKKIKDLNLREGEVNGFDLNTCRGMQQVLEISDASIMKQLALDESEWSDIVADQREKLVRVQNERDVYKEVNRLLLRENIDLRDTLEENDMLDESNVQNLKEVFSAFSDIEESDSNDTELEGGDNDEEV